MVILNVLTKDDEFLNLSREAGVYKWYLGIESISQENINHSGKGTNKVENYAKAIKKIKIMGCLFVVFSCLDSTMIHPDIFDKTLQAMYSWELDEASFSIVTPYPGTRLFQRLKKKGVSRVMIGQDMLKEILI